MYKHTIEEKKIINIYLTTKIELMKFISVEFTILRAVEAPGEK